MQMWSHDEKAVYPWNEKHFGQLISTNPAMNFEDIIFQKNNAINTTVKMPVISVGVYFSKSRMQMFIQVLISNSNNYV